ncbi:efflux RND transporter periplasmic adaptor subunit [Sporolactobacillus kofuensis]|uniref:Efflux RND transporter periplasmic adaptor subunit n=1 Tax=Sporolactobacillus kofuensis TaxID=269672 RepID=A0ABW1WJA1_9BACL|nr:efflux RND transporter periplasmic adaptor subunit [Sporolactobacillus kofuensis]MCO7176397.1 efflux RND transporter periplasmic adaptor subunit [Sporolactobacillus kofuensis]
MKKSLIFILIAVVVFGGGGAYWYFSRDKSSNTRVMIPTTTVQKGTISTDVSGSGALSPKIDDDVTIDSDDAAKTIDTIKVSENDKVEKGDTLLTYTDGTTLTAPHSGTVTSVSAYAGNRVNAGQKVAHITSYSDLNAVLQIDELDIPKIKKGQAVSVTVNAYPNKTFSGKVTSIAQEGTDTNGTSTFNVTVHLNKSTGLKSGMTATGSIVLEKKTNVLYVPSGAVHQYGNSYFVYLSSGSDGTETQGTRGFNNEETVRGKQQGVTIGIHNDKYIEIKSGLQEGETIQLNAITKSSGTSTSSNSQNGYQMMRSMNGGGFGGGGFNGGGTRSGGQNGGGTRQ